MDDDSMSCYESPRRLLALLGFMLLGWAYWFSSTSYWNLRW